MESNTSRYTQKRRSDKPEYKCSFCLRTEKDVRKLIAGPKGVHICNECVALCKEIIDEDGPGAPPPKR